MSECELADPLYPEALALIKDANRPSVSFLQRRLRLGYNRAVLLIQRMEDEGIVSELDNGRRKMLVP